MGEENLSLPPASIGDAEHAPCFAYPPLSSHEASLLIVAAGSDAIGYALEHLVDDRVRVAYWFETESMNNDY